MFVKVLFLYAVYFPFVYSVSHVLRLEIKSVTSQLHCSYTNTMAKSNLAPLLTSTLLRSPLRTSREAARPETWSTHPRRVHPRRRHHGTLRRERGPERRRQRRVPRAQPTATRSLPWAGWPIARRLTARSNARRGALASFLLICEEPHYKRPQNSYPLPTAGVDGAVARK